MPDFQSDFHEFLCARVEAGMSAHERENPEYKKLLIEREDSFTLAEEVIKRLPDDEQEVVARFMDFDSGVQAEEETALYRQGIRDCVGLFRVMGLL